MRWREILNESVKKYSPMFSIFADPDGNLPDWATKRIANIERLLKREDRIVWALRWDRLHAAGRIVHHGFQPESFEKVSARLPRLISEVGLTEAELNRELLFYGSMTGLQTQEIKLEHYLGMPIAEIQNFVFAKQLPSEIAEFFEEAEAKWAQAQTQTLKHSDYPEVEVEGDDDDDDDGIHSRGPIAKIIDFGDGWAWWNLNRAYCEKEGKAMGHCGNKPSARKGDQVLSLRKSQGDGKFRPSLTFILHNDGYLGEMKGRANEKPNAKYHGMIEALLLNPIVKGCRGGGYAHQNNFSLLDLPQDRIELLSGKKPELLSTADTVTLAERDTSDNNVEKMLSRLKRDIRDNSFSCHDIIKDGKEFIIRISYWKNRFDYAERGDSSEATKLGRIFTKYMPEYLQSKNYDENSISNIVKEAVETYFNPVFDAMVYHSYPEDFFLDGVDIKTFPDGSVATYMSVRAYLNPSQSAEWDSELPPFELMEDRCRYYSLDAGYMERSVDWRDVEDNIDLEDEVGRMIAQHCFEWGSEKNTDMLIRAMIVDDDTPYFSRHPDQMTFPFYDEGSERHH